MKLYKTTITPTSNFATTLKGDTLFGQICWGIFYSLEEKRLKELLKNYKENPFLIVSDGFRERYLPKPKMPSYLLKEDPEEKKKNRKKIWLKIDELKRGKFANAKTDKELGEEKEDIIMHNSLNYKGFHTRQGFDPYGVKEFGFVNKKKDIYFLLDETQLELEELDKAFKLVSNMGYGKDTTIGKGRFIYSSFDEVKNFNGKSKYFMTISPFSPNGIDAKNIYYDPFTRFGKFGLNRAYKNAFKKPLLLADTASVIEFEDEIENPFYLGIGIDGLSEVEEYKDTVHQGYSIVVPIGVEK